MASHSNKSIEIIGTNFDDIASKVLAIIPSMSTGGATLGQKIFGFELNFDQLNHTYVAILIYQSITP
jgi:hypothetical protein